MRHLPILSAALAAFGLIAVSVAPAAAFTNTSPAGLGAGTQALDPVETVHCRRAVHKHRPGHGWSRGCHGGSVVIVTPPRRHGVIVRGDRSRSGASVNIRSGDSNRSGTSTTIRSGDSNRSGTSTTIRSGSAPSTGTSTTTTTGAGASGGASKGGAEVKGSGEVKGSTSGAAPKAGGEVKSEGSAPAPKQ